MTSTHDALGAHFLSAAVDTFKSQKYLAEHALAQTDDDDLHWQPDGESNSIAITVQHIAGNMLSRWREFLTTDGEKPDRKRDEEFIDAHLPRGALVERWERGWALLFEAMEGLRPEDLLKTVAIRGTPMTVVESISRAISHYGYHVGQIVHLARHRAAMNPSGDTWKSLSIPKKKP